MRELRLRTSLILLLISAAVLTFTIVGSTILLYRLPQVEMRTRLQLQERAENASRLLDHFMAAVEAQIGPLAHLAGRQSADELQDYVNAIVGEGNIFEAVFVLSANGRVEALGLPDKHRQAAAELRGADFSGNPLFQQARAVAGAAQRMPAIWSDRYLSALAGNNTVGVALLAGDKIIIGEASLERILVMLKDAARNVESVVTIIDGRGQWLASSNPDPNPPGRYFDFGGVPVFQALLNGRAVPDYTEIFDLRLLVGGTYSKKLGWVIVAAAPAGLGNYSYRMTILMVFGGFAGSLLISLALAPLWAARMARPLQALIERTHSAIEGNYASPWPRRGAIAELNQLSSDLGRLVDAVQLREAGIARSEERLRATLESTPSIAIQWLDAGGRILYWNKASEIMYGFGAAEAVGTVIGEHPLMHRNRRQADEIVAVLKRIAKTGQPFGPEEFQRRRKDGNPIVVLTTTFAIPADAGGQIFVCMDIDVTERKQAEKALQESEKKLEAIFNASPAPMSVSAVDNSFRVVGVNLAWERQFRRRRQDVVGLNGAEMGLWADGADRDRFLVALGSNGAVDDMEVELTTGEGRRRLCSVSAQITEIGGERLLLMMTVDITERRRIERQIRELNAELEERVAERTEELLQTNDELEAMVENLKATQEQLVQSEKLAALGNLVAGIAHELNTPIGNGLMAVSTLKERLTEFREAMASGLRRATLDDFVAGVGTGSDIALRNLQRAAELVTSFKQVAVDQTSSQRRRFRVREVVDEILMTLNPTLKRTPYRFEKEIPEELELDSYPGPLGQALTNLINNAVIHGFAERSHGTIRISAAASTAGHIVISVRDDGRGIPADRIGRIFDPFYTTRMGRGGTGLGLHVVHNLVANVLGGAITVISAEGEGTEFTMTLPERAPGAQPPSQAI